MAFLALFIPILPLILVVVALLAFEWWQLRGTGAITVLQEFRLNREPGTEQLIFVRGRRSGVVAWLFTLLGVEGEHVLRVSPYDLTLEKSSLYGFESAYVPLSDIASVSCAYYRAFSFLIVSFVMLALGVYSFLATWVITTGMPYQRQQAYRGLGYSIVGNLVLSAVFYMIYVLSKRIYISVESTGGERVGMSFKRSVIENVSIGLNHALELVELLNNRVLRQRSTE